MYSIDMGCGEPGAHGRISTVRVASDEFEGEIASGDERVSRGLDQEVTDRAMISNTAEDRARLSLGSSGRKIYEMVKGGIRDFHRGGGLLLDVGCGAGELHAYVSDSIDTYVGADIVRYDGFPADASFRAVDLDTGRIEFADGSVDIVACVETIEHVENPRALVRELIRLTRPGGLIIVTTPNQLSLLSQLSLVVKNEFSAFQERPGLYPAHISALLAIDLTRIAKENHLSEVVIRYSGAGRIPGTPWSWPSFMGGRAFSDNVMLLARRPID